MKILGRSLLNYERSRKRLHPNQRPIWRAAGEPPNGTAQLPDAQDHMESSQMEPSCQDGANCQMPRTIWRAARWSRAARMEPAARYPGEPPNGTAQLPDAQDHMESSQMEPSCQDGANCQMPRTIWRAARWSRAARMEPTARCPGELPSELLNETAQLPDAQDPYPAVGATDGHDPPPSC